MKRPLHPVRLVLLGIALLLAAPPAGFAVTPEELLADQALESRARALSKQLRCLVCQNQSIDDSDADLARDLRIEVRRQLSGGASDDQIIANLRATYGDYVLLNPPVSPGTYILWGAPVAILIGGAAIILAARRRRGDAETARDESRTQTAVPLPPGTGRTGIMLGSLVLATSLGIYLMIGRADLPGQPLAERTAELAAAARAEGTAAAAQQAALAEARTAAAANPNDIASWLRLAMAAAAAGESNTELAALEQAETLTNGDPAIRAMRAEAMSRAADGQVTVPVRTLIADILAADPAEPRALFLSGLAAYQDGNYEAAIAIWRQLQALSAPDAPWMELLAQNIADAAQAGGIDPGSLPGTVPGPDEETIAAAAEMSAEDRTAMIEGMVDGLAARLAETPEDAAGWRRLARAYIVLERTADAATALIGAADAMPDDAMAQLSALEHLMVNGLGQDFAPDAGRLLERAARLVPDNPETLYAGGHFARLAGDTGRARMLWQRLLDSLPGDAPIRDQLQAAIDQL